MERLNKPKPMRLSRIQLAQMMQPEHANSQGNVHGGWIMKLVDEAGALASIRHAANRTVTVAIDQMVFHQPIHIGDLVLLNAVVTYAGHTSMEVEVNVIAENPITGQQTHTNTAYLVYVAIDENEKPTRIPPLLAETPEEQALMVAAQARQQRRLAQKVKQSEQRLH
jgi:acyl-CoA hydrolase